jgi:two-component system chemotaxis response regulator CheY
MVIAMERLNVMIVDDSSVVLRVLSTSLTNQGHKVVRTATTGAEAIIAYGACNPDVVIMDITMPDMDGIEATEKIVAKYPDARIIVATSHAEKSVILRARSAGARSYLLKPINPERLRTALEMVMRADLHILNT